MKFSLLSVPFFAAIILTGCNSGTPTTVAARNSTQLTAAGSSFVYPVMMRWVQAYGQGHQGLQINYQSIGSGGGIEQLKNGWWILARPTPRSMTKSEGDACSGADPGERGTGMHNL